MVRELPFEQVPSQRSLHSLSVVSARSLLCHRCSASLRSNLVDAPQGQHEAGSAPHPPAAPQERWRSLSYLWVRLALSREWSSRRGWGGGVPEKRSQRHRILPEPTPPLTAAPLLRALLPQQADTNVLATPNRAEAEETAYHHHQNHRTAMLRLAAGGRLASGGWAKYRLTMPVVLFLSLLLAAAQPGEIRTADARVVLAPYYAPGYTPRAVPERALAPATLAAQRAIWAHQFPRSCEKMKYITMPQVLWVAPAAAALASEVPPRIFAGAMTSDSTALTRESWSLSHSLTHLPL